MIERNSAWRWLFLGKGVWNCGLTTVVMFQFLRQLGSITGPPNPLVAYQPMFLALAFIFGIGYLWVGRDVTRNHDLIRLGILGQLSVFVILSIAYNRGQISPPEYLPAWVDLSCALLFLWFLVQFRESLGMDE